MSIASLNTINNLGALYSNKGKMAEAGEMLLRALRGKEKARGLEHTPTLNTINNLGNLYKAQGKMAEAEKMYLRALRGYEKLSWVPPGRTESVNSPYHRCANDQTALTTSKQAGASHT
ncbi:uncharacterized protein K489DRAFT_379963 [Dissoconium aciculare CBS 342.82]|uniref:TPR-like protein n=1 Tax=Dissoconium aciculare CBS 342.82 TaxID=1314786 RepID=A0A6J3M6W7_9PEZI|nr:uncharacterized protein K489DRAFT_379963 [Dissoconium aciculare CBS 342.82]KAF1822602.1 hypothetical protein K489DRAFT_379963 [Dissoconium aciculare CBS 342.82]